MDFAGLLQKFSSAMEIQLVGNSDRGYGYRSNIQYNEAVTQDLFDELMVCMHRLDLAARGHQEEVESPSLIEHRAIILERAADVANMALLIALNTGSISPFMPVEEKS